MAVGRFWSLIVGTGLTGTDGGDGEITVAVDTAAFDALYWPLTTDLVTQAELDALDITGGRWEIVMADGVTAPPVPVTNEAEDDWLYALEED